MIEPGPSAGAIPDRHLRATDLDGQLDRHGVPRCHAQAPRRLRAAVGQAGGYAPTMGIIGTVFGLVNVLSNLTQPQTLGPMISAACNATLLGVASANVVYLPIAARPKGLSREEMHSREMTIEGILAIQAGENPRVVAEKLLAYVPPSQRPDEVNAQGASAGAEACGADADRAAA
jgi:flagellar motor component MotA